MTNEKGYRIAQCSKLSSVPLILQAISMTSIVTQLVREVLEEVPDADFIEVRAIRYDVEEESNERPAGSAPDPG